MRQPHPPSSHPIVLVSALRVSAPPATYRAPEVRQPPWYS